MIQINLLPDVKREYLRTKTQQNFVISISITVALAAIGLSVVLGLIFGGQMGTEAWQNGKIESVNEELRAVDDLDKSVTLQHQLATVSDQHAEKSINSRLFDVLSVINPPAPNNVRIESLKLDPENSVISIDGSAENGYIALEVFKKTISTAKVKIGKDDDAQESSLAENMVAGSTSFGENAEGKRVLRFSFNFNYPEDMFNVTDDPVEIITPRGRVDVTDSRLGVPESLFGSSKELDESEDEEGSDD